MKCVSQEVSESVCKCVCLCVPECMYMHRLSAGAGGGQISWILELQMVLSCHLSAEKQTGILPRAQEQ